MLLTITTTYNPATDLGYLLHKNPERLQTFELSFGRAHVYYPEVSAERCTAALLLDIDPVGLVRRGRGEGFGLEQYVNDRPYVASSFMSVAIGQVFRTTMTGRSKERQELADTAIPLQATLAVLPCRGGEDVLRKLFEPLGYTLVAKQHPLDEQFPEWGTSRYYTVELEAEMRLHDLLSHLYVLIPVLDEEKHYWIGEDEVEKLLRHGEGWLAAHPARQMIARRYLRNRRPLTSMALSRLAEEDAPDPDEAEAAHAREEEAVEEKISLHEQRLGAVLAVLKGAGVHRVLDLGCGEGRLLQGLIKDTSFSEIVGMDVSPRSLEIASERLHLDRMNERQRARIKLIQGSLTYRDARLSGYDGAAVVEVIEHLDPPRLAAFERVLFEFAKPGTVALTTPNADYNVKFETLTAGEFRHKDHRFEWSRAEFAAWAGRVAERFGYSMRILPIGPEDPGLGAPSQMGVFSRL